MDEFTMSAKPRYADGSGGEPFAEVSAPGLVVCFGAMAAEVGRWLGPRLERGEGVALDAIELTLRWSGASAPVSASVAPEAPSAPAAPLTSPPRRRSRRGGCRRFGCAQATAQPVA